MCVEIFPVIETIDLVYAYRFGWLRPLLEVTSTVVLRPESYIARTFRKKLTIKDFLNYYYGIEYRELNELKIMMDHGIFIENFEKIMGISKTPENLVKMYDILGVDYGLAYDLPAKLYLSVAVDYALSMIRGTKAELSVDNSVRDILYKISHEILSEANIRESKFHSKYIRSKLWDIIRSSMSSRNSRLRDLIEKLSDICVKETCKRFEIQVKSLYNCTRFKTLLPVVQGLFKDHVDECLATQFKILKDNNINDVYLAIGTGGRVLSNDDKQRINYIISKAYELAKRYKMKVKIHLLGWSGPRNAQGLDYSKIYSTDSLTARRRAGEGRIYVIKNDIPRLVHVKEIDRSTYSCACPVCRDEKLRQYVLNPSGERRNDARVVHNIYMLKMYLNLFNHSRVSLLKL